MPRSYNDDSVLSLPWREGHSAALRGDDEQFANIFSGDDRYEFQIGFECGTHDLRQACARLKASLPTASECAERIGIPLDHWKGNCYGIATRLVECGIVRGRAVYGAYEGPVAPTSMFAERAGLAGGINHGWIITPANQIVDPTRWVFLDTPPDLHVQMAVAGQDYDEGANRRRAVFRQPLPAAGDGRRIELPESVKAAFVALGAPRMDAASVRQVGWLANAPLQDLGEMTQLVFEWIDKAGLRALIPVDNWAAFESRHQHAEDPMTFGM